MPDTKDTPIIFLAYANRGRAESIEALQEENRKIAEILLPMEEKRACSILEENPDDNVFLWDLALQPTYKERIQVVHIAGGRPGRKYLRMLSSEGEVALEADEFADFFAQLPNLSLVFITGCANPRLVRRLLMKTRAAVVRIEHDERNKGVTEEFYTQLARGFVLKRAFGQTTINCGDHLMYEILTLSELTAPPFQRRDIFEGLYVRNDNRASLEWKLSPSFFINLDDPKAEAGASGDRTGREEDPSRLRPWLKPTLAGITSLIGVGLLLLVLFSGITNQWVGQLIGNSVCPFPEESNAYNMLILPFYVEETCRRTGNTYRSAVRTYLEQFREEGGVPLNAQYHDADCPTSNFFARGLGGTCNADLVLWATRTQPNEESEFPAYRIEYVSNDRYEESDLIAEQGNPLELEEVSKEQFQEEIGKRLEELVLWSQGMRRFHRKRYDEAIAFFQQILEQSGRPSVACERQIARSYSQKGEHDQALAFYSSAIDQAPNNEGLWVERGQTYLVLNDYDAARQDLQEAQRLNPAGSEVYLVLGKLFQKQNLPDSALAAFNQAVSADPDNIDAYLLRANQFRELKRVDEAFTDYSRCIQKAPNRPEAYRGIGRLYEDMRDYAQAMSYYSKAINIDPEDAESLFHRGRLHVRYSRNDKALIDLSDAIDLSPFEGKYFSVRAMAYKESEEDTLALLDANRGVELAPDQPIVYTIRGQILTSNNAFLPAGRDFDQALELDPANDEAYYGRGILNQTLGNAEKAIEDFTKALELNPYLAYAYCRLGEIYKTRADLALEMGEDATLARNQALALENYDKAIVADSSLSLPYELRADLYVQKGDLDKALRDNSLAIAQNNGRPGPYANRAGIYTALSNFSEAKKDVQRAIELSKGGEPMHFYLLTKIYAAQRDDSLFFQNFELSLERGIPVEEFAEDPVFDLFKNDPRFEQLVAKFSTL